MTAAEKTDRREELLVERALHGLSAREEAELAELRRSAPPEDETSYELAAAAAHLAFLSSSVEALPGGLRARLEREAQVRIRTEDTPSPMRGED